MSRATSSECQHKGRRYRRWEKGRDGQAVRQARGDGIDAVRRRFKHAAARLPAQWLNLFSSFLFQQRACSSTTGGRPRLDHALLERDVERGLDPVRGPGTTVCSTSTIVTSKRHAVGEPGHAGGGPTGADSDRAGRARARRRCRSAKREAVAEDPVSSRGPKARAAVGEHEARRSVVRGERDRDGSRVSPQPAPSRNARGERVVVASAQ